MLQLKVRTGTVLEDGTQFSPFQGVYWYLNGGGVTLSDSESNINSTLGTNDSNQTIYVARRRIIQICR